MDFIQAMMIMISGRRGRVGLRDYGVGEVYRGLQENQQRPELPPAAGRPALRVEHALFQHGRVLHSSVWWMRAFASRQSTSAASSLSSIAWITVPLVTEIP